ncbi:MAG: polysaccharide biosynthesis C-terminal domain-containing protein, partial [Spirochaetales bacterium]|nr:polysaccharide biosynthesis C-terminal domain-containing protein [Candidatus Physcosoma equi]
DQKELNEKMDIYEYVVFTLVFFLFSMGILLITPFVTLYTAKLSDAPAYHQPLFGVLLLISELLYLVKLPHLNLAYSANKFKEITVPAFVEAFLNIGVSVVLVLKYGLIGVAIGTIVGMTYRMVFHVYYTTKLIPGRVQWIFYRKLLLFTVVFALAMTLCALLLPFSSVTIFSWLWHAVLYGCILGVALLGLSVVSFRKEMKFFVRYLKR